MADSPVGQGRLRPGEHPPFRQSGPGLPIEVPPEEAAALLRASAKLVDIELREGTDVASELLAAAGARHADLVVVGDDPGAGPVRRFLGSTGSKVLHHAEASVWIARRS